MRICLRGAVTCIAAARASREQNAHPQTQETSQGTQLLGTAPRRRQPRAFPCVQTPFRELRCRSLYFLMVPSSTKAARSKIHEPVARGCYPLSNGSDLTKRAARAAATSPVPLALRQSVQSARPSKMNLAQTVPNRSPACDANRGFKPSPTLCRTQTVSNRFRKTNRKPSNR